MSWTKIADIRCPRCGTIAKHSVQFDKQYCPKCNLIMTKKLAAEQEPRNDESDVALPLRSPTYYCPQCGFGSQSKHELWRHKQEHKNAKRKLIGKLTNKVCPYCHKRGLDELSDGKEIVYVCPNCKTDFYSEDLKSKER